jgi:hypothetical protein
MRITFIIFALLIATLLADTCFDGKPPQKRTGLGVCHEYEAIEACCTAEMIEVVKESFKNETVCGNDNESYFDKLAPLMCLQICNVKFQNGKFEYMDEDGKVRVCSAFGDYMYDVSKDRFECTNYTRGCETKGAWGCQRIDEIYPSAKEFVNSDMLVYVEDDINCWNSEIPRDKSPEIPRDKSPEIPKDSGSKIAISFTVLIVALIVLLQ